MELAFFLQRMPLLFVAPSRMHITSVITITQEVSAGIPHLTLRPVQELGGLTSTSNTALNMHTHIKEVSLAYVIPIPHIIQTEKYISNIPS